MNIPIYRAKKIDSDEYVIGWYSSPIIIEGKLYLSITNQDGEHRIDTTTLSIHFPDMLDSNGNKIFASLDIKGGSLIEYEEKTFEAMYLNGLIQGVANMDSIQNSLFKYSKIIGIQE